MSEYADLAGDSLANLGAGVLRFNRAVDAAEKNLDKWK